MEPEEIHQEKVVPRAIDSEKTERQQKGLDGDAIAEIDRETMPEVKRDEMTAPPPGGDPEHKRRLSDNTNSLTT